SALAGLIGLTTPSFSVAAIAQRIQQSANSSFPGGGWDQYLAYGVIDAGRAVAGNLRPATVGGIVGQIVDFTGLPVVAATVAAGGESVTTQSAGAYQRLNLASRTFK